MTGPGPGHDDPAGSPGGPEPLARPGEIPSPGENPSSSSSPDGEAVAPDAPTQRTGIISAAPVGWSAGPPPAGQNPAAAPGDQPLVAWAAPAAPAAPTAVGEGLVIAGVFSRLVAFVIDGLILATITLVLGLLIGAYRESSTTTLQFGAGLVGVAISGLYFVALWTSGWSATLGMRLIGLRVLRAADGGTLPLDAALVRWLALEGIVQLLSIVRVGQGITGLIALVWIVALLVTTATDRLRQGFHDRWAGSVVVQPAPGGSGAAVVGCLVIVALMVFIPFLLVLLVSNDLRDILSRVGQSI